MAFRKKFINEIFGTVLVLSGLLSTASAVDCYGKSFHCVNSTHFMICVDLGGGVSQSIDSFLIPCPPPTVCQGNNHFECEFPVTTPSTTLSNVISETTQPWEEIVVTTKSPPTNTTKEYSEKYLNTLSITTVDEDSFTTDATVDITTAVISNDVNSNLHTTEIVTTSVYDKTTGLNEITRTIPESMGAAENTTEKRLVLPLNQKQNVTNETLVNEKDNNNITLSSSLSESTITKTLIDGVASNDNLNTTSEIKNGTIEVGNVTSKTEFDHVTTPATFTVDSSIDADQPVTTTTEKKIVTGTNIEITTAQSLNFTDASKNTENINVQNTSTEPTVVQNSSGTEKPYIPVIEYISTEGVPNFATEQPTILNMNVQNVTEQSSITTYQSTVTDHTVTSKYKNDEVAQLNSSVTAETSVGSDEPTTMMYDDKLSTAGIDKYTATAPLISATKGKQDTQIVNVSDQVPTKTTDDTIIYSGTEDSKTNKIDYSVDMDTTTTKPRLFIQEALKPQGTEQQPTNKNNLVTDNDAITNNLSVSTTEIQELPGTEQPKTKENSSATDKDAITEKPSVFNTEKPNLADTEQPKIIKISLANDNDAITENPRVFTTEPTNLFRTELTTNKNGLATDNDTITEKPSDFTNEIQNLSGTEQPTANKHSLATDTDVITEKPSVFITEKPNLSGTEQLTTNQNNFAIDTDTITEKPSVFTTEKPNSPDTEPSTTNKTSSANNDDSITVKQSVFTTEIQKLYGTEQPTTNKNSLATDNDAIAEKPSVLTPEAQKLPGIQQPPTNINSLATDNDAITEKASLFTTDILRLQEAEHTTTNKNSLAIDNVFTPEIPTLQSIEQSTTYENNLATSNDATETPSDFTTETQKLQRTLPPTTNKTNLTTDNDIITEKTGIFTTEIQRVQQTEQLTINKNSLATANNVITELPSDFTTELQTLQGSEQHITNKNSLTTDNDAITGKASSFTTALPKSMYLGNNLATTIRNYLLINIDVTTKKPSEYTTKIQNSSYLGPEQPSTKKNSLATDTDTITEKGSVFITEIQKVQKNTKQPTITKNSLATGKDVITEQPSVFTTEKQTLQASQQQTTNKNSLATGNANTIQTPAITETPSVFNLESQNLPGNEQPTTAENNLATDDDTTTEKTISLKTETPSSIHMENEPTTTNRNDLLTDIDVKSKNQVAYTTKKSSYVSTEQSSINKNRSTPNKDAITESSGFTTETQKAIYSSTEQPIPGITNLPIENEITTENPSVFSTPMYMGSEMPPTNKNTAITDSGKMTEKASVFTTVTQKQIYMIYTNISTQPKIPGSANGVTIDISPNFSDDVNVPVINNATSVDSDTKVATISAFKVTEANRSSQNTVKPIVDNIVKNEQVTESYLNDNETPLKIRKTTTYYNVVDTELSKTSASISDHSLSTDIVNSKVTTTDPVNLIQVLDVGAQGNKQLPAVITDDLITTPNSNFSSTNDLLDSTLYENISNETTKNISSYPGQYSEAEVTSETTATEKFTPSLNPIYESFQQTSVTSSHQVSTENANIVIDNLAYSTGTFTAPKSAILRTNNKDLDGLPEENGNTDNTFTSLNPQDNSYPSLTTEKSISFHDNVVNNLDTISEIAKPSHEPTRAPPQKINFQPSSGQNVNLGLENATASIFVNKGNTFSENSTAISETDLELHIPNKNETIQKVETTQTIENIQTLPTITSNKNVNVTNLNPNPLLNILFDKINQVDRPTNDAGTSLLSTSSTATFSTTDHGPLPYNAAVADERNSDDLTTQSSIPLYQITDNLPPIRHDSVILSVPDNMQKILIAGGASMAETGNLPVIQLYPTTLKNTSVFKKEVITNAGKDIPSSEVLMTDSTTEFLVQAGEKNVYKTIGSPLQTSTQGNTNIKGNSDISPVQPSYGTLDASKTSSSIPKTESSLLRKNNSINSLINKLGPSAEVANLSPSVPHRPISNTGVNSDVYSTKLEMTTEATKNNEESKTTLEKPAISESLLVPYYKIRLNPVITNEPIPNASYATEVSETKILTEPYSVTSDPGKVTPSIKSTYGERATSGIITATGSHDISITTEETYSIVSLSSQQQLVNTVKTDGKISPENYNIRVTQNNEERVSVRNISLINSSLSVNKTHSGSKSPILTETNISQGATNKNNNLNSLTDSENTTAQDAREVRLEENATEAEKNEANRKTFPNSSIGPNKIYIERNSTIINTVSKNVSQSTHINENDSSVFQNSTNASKSNKDDDLKSQQKTSTNSTRPVAGQVKTTKTPKHAIIHTVTTHAPTTKVIPKPVSQPTENPIRQISQTAVVNYSCINGLRGRYSDKDDCRKFYICIGNSQPIIGTCPVNTVFSDISKLCTKNLSHCVRENEFKCPTVGRFSDIIKDTVYYICVNYKNHLYRFKFQCQKGFTLNKTTLRCTENKLIESNESVSVSLSENSSGSEPSSKSDSSSTTSDSSKDNSGSSSSSSSSDDISSSSDSGNNSDSSNSKNKEKKEKKEKKESKEKPEDDEEEVFECEKEGKFPVRNDCRRYYLCKKNGKSEYRRKIKKCESGDVFHKDKKNTNDRSSSDDERDGDKSVLKRRRNRHEKEEEPENKEEDEDEEHEIFKCEKEGKFPVRDDCRRYYLCKRKGKSKYRRKIKKCDSGDVFHKDKKKCVDADSYEC